MTNDEIRTHVREVAAICAGRPNVVLELGNELYHPSQSEALQDPAFRSELRTIAREAGFAGPIADGAADVDEPIDGVYPTADGNYATVHLDRGRDFWNQCRRVREIYAVVEAHAKPALDNEPLGADEVDGSVSGKQRSDDPAFFATLGALDRGFTGVGGIHHSQAGLDAVLPGPVQQRCADAYVAAQLAVDSVLGQDIPSYRNAGHVDSPVLSFADAVRCYSFTVGNRGVTVGLGLGANPGIAWGNGWRPTKELYAIQAHDGRWLRVWDVQR